MLAVLLFDKKYENQGHASNVELPKIMPVLDLKPWSPVFWRSKSCKTISLTGVYFFLFNESATQRYIDRRHPSTFPLESFFDSPQLPVSSRNMAEWKENYLEKSFEKFGFTSRGCRVCLGTSGNAGPFTTESCRKFKPEVLVVLVHNVHCPEQRLFLSDVRQSEVDFLHSWASSLRENTVTAQMW